MTNQPPKSERREFTDALRENWDSAKKRTFSRTRADQQVAKAIDDACADDVNAHFAVSKRNTGFSVGPSLDSEEGQELLATGEGVFAERKQAGIVVYVDEDKRISRRPQAPIPPALMAAWRAFHPTWVAALTPVVVAEAIQRLRAERSELLADRRRKRKNVNRNGHRTKANKPGPRPPRKLNFTGKSGLKKHAA